ncbi:MAG: T9SS type A sorting domain-containing protein, partial [Bacteroidota bacterium]
DANSTVDGVQAITLAGVDSAAEVLSDNSYTNLPPKVKVRTTVMAWKNQKYIIVRYRVIADTASLGSLYMGAVIIPKPSQAYGGESIKYSGAKKTTSFFRVGEASYWGVKVLSPNALGVSMLDWDIFSPTDPNNDAATDSTRYAMLSTTGYKDSLLVAGSNGSVFTVNVGKASFAKLGDSATYYYAIGYGTTESEMNSALDSATAKYPKISTSVQKSNVQSPNGFLLEQNYPNPFNPSTRINFSIGTSSYVSVKVFDALGREVRSLVSQQLETGSYTVPLSAENLSSGMYYYTMQAGNYKETKKMMLMK